MSPITQRELNRIMDVEYSSSILPEESQDCVEFLKNPETGFSYFFYQFATFRTNCEDADGHPKSVDHSLTIHFRRETK